jgi:hypothetical protein
VDQAKRVVLVEAHPGQSVEVRSVPLSAGRLLVDVAGTLDELRARAETLRGAFLRVELRAPRPEPGLVARVKEILPDALEVRCVYTEAPPAAGRTPPARPTLTPAAASTRDAAARTTGKRAGRSCRTQSPRCSRSSTRRRCVRPRRLRVKGYTAFVEEADVDFDGLDLFAITGPTGAGKTSLLQAMTIALYGRAPKLGDDLRQLISPSAERAHFSFEFRAHGRGYRIARVLFRSRATQVALEAQGDDGEWQTLTRGVREGKRAGGANPRARLRQLHEGRAAAPERV